MGIIIEVGVNTGSDTAKLLNRFPGSTYYGFEPTAQLYQHLTHTFNKSSDYKRINFYPFAISDKTGKANFNIAGQGDWGCSSLNDFNPDIHSLWPHRSDFKFTDTQEVVTIRLDTFLEQFAPENKDLPIDFLWIDAQGHDIKVFESLGKYMKNSLAGRMEVAYNVELYTNTNNTLVNAETILKNNKFQYKVTPDDVSKECNIDFWR